MKAQADRSRQDNHRSGPHLHPGKLLPQVLTRGNIESMAILDVRLKDLATGKLKLRTFTGPRERLEKLKKRIIADRARHKPPDTAIHTPIPAGISPSGFVASFQVVDPLVIEDD